MDSLPLEVWRVELCECPMDAGSLGSPSIVCACVFTVCWSTQVHVFHVWPFQVDDDAEEAKFMETADPGLSLLLYLFLQVSVAIFKLSWA